MATEAQETKVEEPQIVGPDGLVLPGVKRIPGKGLVREVPSKSGTTYRPVALTVEEARAKRMDYYHPEFGWLIDGFKLVRDRDAQDIFQDGSASIAKLPE